MTKAGKSRGFRAERDLVAKLWKRGFAVIRAPASGSKIKRAVQPDIVAIKRGRVAVFEVKSRSKEGTIYIEREQVEKLLEFAERAGGKAYVAVKISGFDWVFVPVELLEPTSSGYKVSRDILAKGLDVERLEVDLGVQETLNKYSGVRS